MSGHNIDLKKIASEYKANAEERRVIVCAGTACVANGALPLIDALVKKITEAGLKVRVEAHEEGKGDIRVSKSGCHGFCQMGPLVTILPENYLYTRVKVEDVAEIVDASGLRFLPDDVVAQHVGYGMVLGPDGRPFKTRDGKAATLDSLLDAAEEEAAPNIALAAIKYADLSSGLQKDYTFDVERMVQTTGNTGPYLQYAHARVSQILRRAEAEGIHYGSVAVLDEPVEQQLALTLSGFGDVVDDLAQQLQPHKLCTYLYELAGTLASFYEVCPVLKSDGDVRASRLAMCAATKQVLAKGLYLLGIDAPERM